MGRTVVTFLSFMAMSLGNGLAQGRDSPPGWRWHLERGSQRATGAVQDSTWRFDQMPPGWHITTGPAGLLYPTTERASGVFSLVADFVVFPETTDSGFGLFVGGSNVETDSSSYVAALLRRDGAVSVIHNARGTATALVPWIRHSAIKPHTGSGTVTNRLRVNASADSIRVFVNDSAVARLALASAVTSGTFGFKVGEGVNLHLTILDYTRHMAPARSK